MGDEETLGEEVHVQIKKLKIDFSFSYVNAASSMYINYSCTVDVFSPY